MKTTWQVKFIIAFCDLFVHSIYPSAVRLSVKLHNSKRGLNGRECKFRTALMKEFGISKRKN